MKKNIIIFYSLILVFFILTSLLLITISFLPFSFVKSSVNLLAPDKDLEVFKEFSIPRIKLLSLFFSLTTLVIIIFFKKVQNYISEIFTSWRLFFKDIKNLICKIYHEDKVYLFLLLFIFLAGIGLRLFFINQPMRHDEAISFVTFANIPLSRSLLDYSTSNNHFLHTFFLHISYLIFGNQIWAIRLTAFMAGIFIIPAAYLVGRIFYNNKVGLIASAFIAVSSPLISYSTNARGYTLVTLFFLLALALIKYLKDNNNKTGWLFFGIINFLGFFTIPTYLYSFGILIVFLLLIVIFRESEVNKKILLKNTFSSLAFTIILSVAVYSPAIIFSNFDSGIVSSAIKSNGFIPFLRELPLDLKTIWLQWTRDIHFSISILLIIGVLISLIFLKSSKIKKINLIFPCLIWLIPVLFVQRPTMFERLWLFLLPIFFILGTSGIVFIIELIFKKINIKKIISIILISLITLSIIFGLGYTELKTKSIYYSTETGILLEAEEITTYLKKELKPTDRVLLECPSEWPLKYYFDKYDIPFYFLDNDLSNSERIFIIFNYSYKQNIDTVLLWTGINNINNFEKPRELKKLSYSSLYVAELDVSGLVSKIFEVFSGKTAEAKYIKEWTLKLKNKESTLENYTIDTVNQNKEYINNIEDNEFITILYNALLNRQPDEPGFKGWIAQLESGVTKEKIIKDFLKSEEFISICNRYKIIAN